MTNVILDIRSLPTTAARLEQIPGVNVRRLDPPTTSEAQALPDEWVEDTEILACSLPPTNLAAMTSLRFIQLSSVGYAQLYGHDLPARGIRASNARGVFDTAIAEWNLAMMINLARDLRTMIRNQDHGVWNRESDGRFQFEIRGGVVGLWGYGGIGRETARLAKCLGMTVHAFARHGVGIRENCYQVAGTGDPTGQLPDRVFGPGEELDFLAGLDYLVLAMPLTPASTGCIGERELRALKRTACLLNPARGGLIQEGALLRALREGWIAGAALDTHYYYPMPADHPLWRFPNVIMTPHISGSDRGPHFLARMEEILMHNVQRWTTGQSLWNELSVEELDSDGGRRANRT